MGLRYTKEQVDEFTNGISAMILGIRGIEGRKDMYPDHPDTAESHACDPGPRGRFCPRKGRKSTEGEDGLGSALGCPRKLVQSK